MITSHYSGNMPTLTPFSEQSKTKLKKEAEIKPKT